MNSKKNQSDENDSSDITAEKMNNSVKAKKESTKNDSVEAADAVLRTAAQDAKKAEKFDHGKNDAGKKS